MALHRLARNGSALDLSSVHATDAGTPLDLDRPPAQPRRRRRCPTAHMTAGQCNRLLALIDDAGGVVTLDEISRAMPRVQQPVSAVFDLCDAGILNVDWEAAFDGDMHVWRVDR